MTKEEIIAAVESAVREHGGAPGKRESKFTCPDPTHHANGDQRASACWNSEKKTWWCPIGQVGGGYMDLARRWGLLPDARAKGARAPRRKVISERVYVIRDLAGIVIAEHVRLDFDDGTKTVYWRRNGKNELGDLAVEAIPLFGTETLASERPGAMAIITEGEKAAESLIGRGFLALGTVTGAGTAQKPKAPSVDVLRVLSGFDVVLWPDNDPPGRAHMMLVAERLRSIGIEPRWVEWPDAPPKGDAADYAGPTEELQALLSSTSRASSDDSRDEGHSDHVDQAAAPRAAIGSRGPSQATHLVDLADDFELFHTPGADPEPFCSVEVADHRETYRVRSQAVRALLLHRFYRKHKKAANDRSVREALACLEARAIIEGDLCPVALRLAEYHGAIYLDLGDETWRAVQVTAADWRVVDDPPVRFRRARGMLPLPVPVRGGSVDMLRAFVNVASDDDWRLLVGCLLAALRPCGPYPVLALHGEQGSAKTTTAKVLRNLIDPNIAPLRSEPRDERDLVIAAKNAWVIALENLSHLPPRLSDALCRLATGSGFGTRELFTDQDEVLFQAMRPIMLNGIEEVATCGDLVDRQVALMLPAILDRERRSEREFWPAFDAARPALLGALLTAVAGGLRHLPDVRLAERPRMADFAEWATACERALDWPDSSFLQAYDENRATSTVMTLEASAVAEALQVFATKMSINDIWKGTATELLKLLLEDVSEAVRRDRHRWPQNGRALSGALRRLNPGLRAVGIVVEFVRAAGGKRRRLVHVRRGVIDRPDRPDRPEDQESPRERGDAAGTVRDANGTGRDANASSGQARDNRLVGTGRDGRDANFPPSGTDPLVADLDDSEEVA